MSATTSAASTQTGTREQAESSANRPEFDFSADSLTDIFRAIDQRGCALVRGLVPRDQVVALHERASAAYALRDDQYHQGELAKHMPVGRYQSGVLNCTDLDLAGDPACAFLRLMLEGGLGDTLVQYWGEDVAIPMHVCVPRRQFFNGPNVPTPFHQDASFLPKLVGAEVPLLNAWVPLVQCGKSAPGLEILPVALNEQLPISGSPLGDVYDFIDVGKQSVRERFGETHLWIPEFDVGDVMFFTPLTVHRTYQCPDMTGTRISIEMRSIGASVESMFPPIMPIAHWP